MSFHDDLQAQFEWAQESWERLFSAFHACRTGDELPRMVRVEAKHLIASIKHILDQLTLAVWELKVAPHLSDTVASRRRHSLYYQYDVAEHEEQRLLGNFSITAMVATHPDILDFIDWVRQVQPWSKPQYATLGFGL